MKKLLCIVAALLIWPISTSAQQSAPLAPARVVNGLLGWPYAGKQMAIGTPQPNGGLTLLQQVMPNPYMATPTNGATNPVALEVVLGRYFDVTQFGGSAAIDNCSAYRALATAVQNAGGGTVLVVGNQVSSCAVSVSNVPVAFEGVGGEGQSSITFTGLNNAGLVINENDGHKRVSVRKLRLYTTQNQPTGVAAVKVTFPSANAPDVSAVLQNIQVDYEGTGYFANGIICANCTHFVFDSLNIQGAGLASGATTLSNTMNSCVQTTGFSGNGKLTNMECTNAINGVVQSGDTEGTKVTNINTVSVNQGYVLDDGTSGDSASAPYYPGPHITNWHCDAYLKCLWTKGWSQVFLSNFNFFKRPQSNQYWTGIDFGLGSYSGNVYPSIHNQAMMGACRQNGTSGGATCVTLEASSAAIPNTNPAIPAVANDNDISFVQPDGMNYFVDEQSTTTNNQITDNKGFPPYTGWYNQTSIFNSWRTNPSPFNYSRRNAPAVLGSQDTSFNALTANSATPNVGGFNLLTFHTANTSATTITNFLNGAQGETIVVVATDANTTIATNGNITTTSGSNLVMTNGSVVRFVLDGSVWRQV